MKKRLDRAIKEYVKLLKGKYGAKIVTAVLFGSSARGDVDKESDADILIIISDSSPKIKDEISMSAYEIMLKNDVVLSPLVMDKDAFSWYEINKDPLYKNILRDGINLWTSKQKNLLKYA